MKGLFSEPRRWEARPQELFVAGIVPSRYTSLTSLRFTVQWIYAILVAHLCLLYEDTRMRYPLLSFSSTLLVTEESGGCIGMCTVTSFCDTIHLMISGWRLHWIDII